LWLVRLCPLPRVFFRLRIVDLAIDSAIRGVSGDEVNAHGAPQRYRCRRGKKHAGVTWLISFGSFFFMVLQNARELSHRGSLPPRPSLLTTVGRKVLVCEGAIRKWFNNFNLGLTKAYVAIITSGSELTVISIKSVRILRLDGLIQRFQIGIEAFEHLVDRHVSPLR